MNKMFIKNILFTVILLISALIVLITAKKASNVMGDNIYSLTLKKDYQYFSKPQLSNLDANDIFYSYAYKVFPKVSNGFCDHDISVIVTNENYRYFSDIEIKKGAFFNGSQIDRKSHVAVINTMAAYQTFGNYNCIGEYVYLNQRAFKIIGIVEGTDDMEAEIYIPSSLLTRLEISNAEPEQILCVFHNIADAELYIKEMGYSIEDINIEQLDFYKKVFWQRFYLIPVFSLLVTLFYTWKKIRLNKLEGKKKVCIRLIALAQIICLISVMRSAWCVPPGYELINDEGYTIFELLFRFYTLQNMKLYNMAFLSKWNIVSFGFFITSFVIIFFGVCIQRMKQ